MKDRGVLGGSMLGTVLVQADTKASSADGAEARSVENRRDPPATAADADRFNKRVVA